MAHWDDERDKRWVEMLRRSEIHYPQIKPMTDAFEKNGDTIYWSAALDLLRSAWNKEELERRPQKTP